MCAPCTTLTTPAGKPALCTSSARIMAAPGSRSDGLRMRVLPVTVAMGMHQSGIMAGKSGGSGQLQHPTSTRFYSATTY